MGVGDGGDDRQPEAEAVVLAFGLHEPVEHPGPDGRVDARAGVADPELDVRVDSLVCDAPKLVM